MVSKLERQPTADVRERLVSTDEFVTLLAALTGFWLLISAWVLAYPTTETGNDAHLMDVGAGTLVLLAVAARWRHPLRRGLAVLIAVVGGWVVSAQFVWGYWAGGGAGSAWISELVSGAALLFLGIALLWSGLRAPPGGGAAGEEAH